jgi:hypothetical protein
MKRSPSYMFDRHKVHSMHAIDTRIGVHRQVGKSDAAERE